MADAKDAENPELTIDLKNQEIRRPNGGVIKFNFDEFRRHCLLNGLDDIGLTLQKDNAIDAFESKRKGAMDWVERGTSIPPE
jgi:3-isopropylmalate/(R)-2-methylmalate dehydratase small subunit